jgi:hypothetical protein
MFASIEPVASVGLYGRFMLDKENEVATRFYVHMSKV